MHRQKSFGNEMPTLYLVPTPIGNLDEMTPRAIEILKNVDVIACEDTRNSMKLLQHFDIHTRYVQYHNFNEQESSKGLLLFLEQGKNVAVISDAGYPLISDPGQVIVSKAISLGYNVVPLSGCNAMLNALVGSGLITQPFMFIGFLPANQKESVKVLNQYKHYPMTLIFYEAPHRIEKMLASVLEVFGDRQVCVARELTKRHEEFIRGLCSEVLEEIQGAKGEMVVVVEGFNEELKPAIDMNEISLLVDEAIQQGLSKSDAIKAVAKQTGMSKNEIYNYIHQN
ncbi:16S rRNA (cytidine(1402)-2'-O)-methyltransferase [Anaerorhabdus sp.]|uniref:16S rRNA (cytidine(1402)-2'-O)-methyltransferase n=1 Tax=Anaerorhabdus sp. TaxID=1872524 RepID=UPI002FC60A8B